MDQNMHSNQRGSFGSNLGFLMSAIGSAVGLGNIWGFPYKMGACGGFTFLLVYLALAVFVGFAIMLGELALGRKTGFGPVNAYKAVSKRFKWIGWLAIIAPFLIRTFYSVLGGYCIWYIIINVIGLFGSMPGSESFGAMLMSIMIGWELKPAFFHDEINSGYSGKIHGFWGFCLKFICPIVMFFILLAQVDGFFGFGWF